MTSKRKGEEGPSTIPFGWGKEGASSCRKHPPEKGKEGGKKGEGNVPFFFTPLERGGNKTKRRLFR